jgi:hypothetical protein
MFPKQEKKANLMFLEKIRAKYSPQNTEKGNMLIWYVFMMPVFLSFVGLAVDFSIAVSSRTGLQASLDAATQGTVALSKNASSGKPRLSDSEARASVVNLYDRNRSGVYAQKGENGGVPFMTCRGTTPGPVSGCAFNIADFKYKTDGGLQNTNDGYLSVTVKEEVDTIFLSFLGMDSITISINSTARLSSSET